MNILKAKRARYYLRLAYPVRIVVTAQGCVGTFPDLPGLTCRDASLADLYPLLELTRRQWITERVLADLPIAAPNAHLLADEAQAEQVA